MTVSEHQLTNIINNQINNLLEKLNTSLPGYLHRLSRQQLLRLLPELFLRSILTMPG
jgi:hypothetical protein